MTACNLGWRGASKKGHAKLFHAAGMSFISIGIDFTRSTMARYLLNVKRISSSDKSLFGCKILAFSEGSSIKLSELLVLVDETEPLVEGGGADSVVTDGAGIDVVVDGADDTVAFVMVVDGVIVTVVEIVVAAVLGGDGVDVADTFVADISSDDLITDDVVGFVDVGACD